VLTASANGQVGDVTFKSKVIDPENNSVTEIIADSKGKILKKTTFFFDENNWSKSAIHYGKDGKVRYKEVMQRDEAGRILTTWLYSSNDKVLGKRTFKYNADGTVADIKDFDAEGRPIARAVLPAGTTEKVTRPTSKKKR
jgi:hypothetical protein